MNSTTPTRATAGMEPGQAMRLRGRVRTPRADARWAVASATLVGTERGSAWSAEPLRVREAFDLVLEDGAVVRVETSDVPPDAIVPEQQVHGTFGEIASHPLAESFRARAPGPHVRVVLRGAGVSNGDAVEVYGVVQDVGFRETDGGMRAAPERVVTKLRAALIAGGADPARAFESAFDARYPPARWASRERTLRRWRAVAAASLLAPCALFAATAMLGRPAPVQATSVNLGVVLAGIGVFWRDALRFFALGFDGPVIARGVQPENRDTILGHAHATKGFALLAVFAAVGAGFVALAAFIGVIAAMPASGDKGCMARPIGLLGALALWALALLRVLATRRSARAVRLLLASPAHAHDARDDAWGTSSGVARSNAPVATAHMPATLALLTETEVTPGSDPNLFRMDLRSAGAFVIETATGLVEIDPSEAVWTSTVQRTTRHPATRTGAGRRVERVELVPVGARVLAAGYLHANATANPAAPRRLAARGPESLYFFATGPTGDPRAELAAMARARTVTIALLLLLGAGLAASTMAQWTALSCPASTEESSALVHAGPSSG